MRFRACVIVAVSLAAFLPRLVAEEAVDVLTAADVVTIQPNTTDLNALQFRVRVTALTPKMPVAINWRYGGEGLGGEVIRGTLVESLEPGEWSPPVPVTRFVKGRDLRFLTFTLGHAADPADAKNKRKPEFKCTGVEMEFEFSYQNKVIKTFKETGPDGPTVGIAIPLQRLAGPITPGSPEFLDDLGGLLNHATRRAESLEALPWGKIPVMQRYLVITDLAGYGAGAGYGIRHTNRTIVETECRALRALGINGVRGAPEFLLEMIGKREGFARDLARGCELHGAGYPVPQARQGREAPAGAGCPFDPGIAERQAQAIAAVKEHTLKLTLPEVWALTVDEIGPIVNGAPEGKRHLAVCPRCADGFREYLKGQGLTPQDFGKADWAAIAPVDLWPEKPKTKSAAPATEEKPAWAADAGGRRMAYYTRKFNNWSSARLFTPLRDALSAANDAKRRALAAGETDSPAARQPFVYSFALRGNTFLMGGASLDFFDFYRHADNALVYETSNRDPRVWHWDSYLCDVGRSVSARQKIEFGIYVKPHRGAPVQRALSAVGRGARFLFWYTYGPDYHKGDSFSQSPTALVQTSRAAHLIGGSEEVLYGSEWAVPAEIAIVRTEPVPGVAEASNNALMEEGKWTFTALAHAHLPVEPLDETFLTTEDLSRYKALYLIGHTLPKKVAEEVVAWVAAGGTLYTSAGGLAYDEAGAPLETLRPVLGLKDRTPVELWRRVATYGATSLQSFDDARDLLAPVPDGAAVKGEGPFTDSLKPIVGREVLQPDAGTEVLARFADGGAAATRHKHGQGEAYVIGFYPGLEYSAAVRAERFDMLRDFPTPRRSWIAAPALARVKPVVDADRPTIEGLLLMNRTTNRRAVVVMNWTWRATRVTKTVTQTKKGAEEHITPIRDLVPAENVRLVIRGAGEVTKATSTTLGCALTIERAGEAIAITLPKLEEGDVLLLE